ncbi:rhomboid protease GluP [Weissella uvarum]|uniref:rhomboid family intramembrane serine protease n=1 Tax=Weissella uvarum TaxID=1479233 RepID=UPI00196182F6|nr:rhomboid family intramembrane serine protease [Weissella uvarum]MBM7616636.1 rhomboid protease GluP [Weissella uvarum]MCM0594906.1 rhomboid family intramembrane serine protease [Weissella uvarum]
MTEIEKGWRGFKAAPMTWTLTGVMVLVFCIELVLSRSLSINSRVLYEMGGAYSLSILHGEWWRLLTAGFLHGSFLHIACNLVVFVWMGRMLEPLLGASGFLILFVNGVLAGNLLSLWLSPVLTLNIGASGGIFSFFASFIVFWLTAWHRQYWQEQAKGMAAFVVLSLVLNIMSPNVSVWGHVGGFIGGLVLTLGVMWHRQLKTQFKVNWMKIGLSWLSMLGLYAGVLVLIQQRFGG